MELRLLSYNITFINITSFYKKNYTYMQPQLIK